MNSKELEVNSSNTFSKNKSLNTFKEKGRFSRTINYEYCSISKTLGIFVKTDLLQFTLFWKSYKLMFQLCDQFQIFADIFIN